MKNGVIVLLAFAAAGVFVAAIVRSDRRQATERAEVAELEARRAANARPKVVEVAPGLSVEVTSSMPPNAQLLCSKCLHPFPPSKIHTVPTYDDHLGRYVGSYRCDDHWKAALSETRARITADASVDEVGGMLEVLVSRGVPKERLRTFTEEKSLDDAALAVLDALERGRLVVPLP